MRKPKQVLAAFTLRLPPEVHQAIKEFPLDMSMNDFMAEAVIEAAERQGIIKKPTNKSQE